MIMKRSKYGFTVRKYKSEKIKYFKTLNLLLELFLKNLQRFKKPLQFLEFPAPQRTPS
jgi:hypothetical protein